MARIFTLCRHAVVIDGLSDNAPEYVLHRCHFPRYDLIDHDRNHRYKESKESYLVRDYSEICQALLVFCRDTNGAWLYHRKQALWRLMRGDSTSPTSCLVIHSSFLECHWVLVPSSTNAASQRQGNWQEISMCRFRTLYSKTILILIPGVKRNL